MAGAFLRLPADYCVFYWIVKNHREFPCAGFYFLKTSASLFLVADQANVDVELHVCDSCGAVLFAPAGVVGVGLR